MATISECAHKGFSMGVLAFVVEAALQFKSVKHPLINCVSNMTAVTVANYAIRGNHFMGDYYKDWKESSKATASMALAFFLTQSYLKLGNHFDRSICPMETKTSALLWLFCYKGASI